MKHVLFEKNSLFSIEFVGGLFCSRWLPILGSVYAQNEPRYNRIASLVASNEMKSYQKDLRSGAPFAEKHQRLLLDEGLPQLVIDGNRLDRVTGTSTS